VTDLSIALIFAVAVAVILAYLELCDRVRR
jgi:hypothetical protein